MKKLKLLANLLVISITGFAQVPSADFTSSWQDIEAWDHVIFKDRSTGNPTSWQWSFYGADPGTSTDQNPSEIFYPYPGTYPVTLTVTNASGSDTETRTSYITVGYPSPLLNIFQCHEAINLSSDDPFIIDPVFIGAQSAEDYKMTIINADSGPFYYKSLTTGGQTLVSKSSFPGLEYYRHYTCMIQAKFNGTWTPFGRFCQFVTLPQAHWRMKREGSNTSIQLAANFFPNPTDGNGFNLSLTGLTNEENKIQINIYDLYGKQVYSEQINHGNGELLKKITPTESLSTGVYLVRVDVNGEILQEKLNVR